MGCSSDAWEVDLTRRGEVSSSLNDQQELHGDRREL